MLKKMVLTSLLLMVLGCDKEAAEESPRYYTPVRTDEGDGWTTVNVSYRDESKGVSFSLEIRRRYNYNHTRKR